MTEEEALSGNPVAGCVTLNEQGARVSDILHRLVLLQTQLRKLAVALLKKLSL
jgi:hypothetical protein